jgi:hypothetical protein
LGPKNKRKLGSITPLGTACAISDDVVCTAFHNIGKFEACGIVKQLRGHREIAQREVLEVNLIDCNVTEDWALLKRQSGRFGVGQYCTNIILNEGQLPSDNTQVAIFDYPVGVLTASRGTDKLQCDTLRGHICWYEGPKTGTEASSSAVLDTWKVVESVENDEPESRVVVQGGRSHGSCGAPYVTYRGYWFAFHVASFNDEGESQASHTHYSTGVVFARSPNFKTAYDKLNV